ncbi:hypothetical protein GV828_06875 [Flavobacterium sp. NST-5]|uniref:Signal peptidase n=1 Tax=Flavobacterium ichthyis TaxID=2698827 RepID=A0ABW9ZCV6_9FLAO|nr:hypothetical protein [Flavobacterium ichthyis]NBL64920.1 hypothetical protein [Flavobacterium ichthyis]
MPEGLFSFFIKTYFAAAPPADLPAPEPFAPNPPALSVDNLMPMLILGAFTITFLVVKIYRKKTSASS